MNFSQKNQKSNKGFSRLTNMDIESILASGLVTSVIASVIAVSVQYISKKQEKERERQIEHTDQNIANVYSPLLFRLFESIVYLTDIMNNFKGFEKVNGSEANYELLALRLKKNSNKLDSDSIRNLLVTRLGFIQPMCFQKDLFSYLQALKEFEKQIGGISEVEFQNPESKKLWFEDIASVCLELLKATRVFGRYVNDGMDKKKWKKLDYLQLRKSIDFDKMMALVESRLNLQYDYF